VQQSAQPYQLPSMTTILNFAPQVRFSEYETNFPCTIGWLLQNATLRSSTDPSFAIPNPSMSQLAQYSAADYFLDINPNAYGGPPPVQRRIAVPMLVSFQFYDDLYIDINYIFLYLYQGPKVLDMMPNIRYGVTEPFFCLAPNFGTHQADVERIVVRLLPDEQTLAGVGFEAHGHTVFYTPDQVSMTTSTSTNPVVNAALFDHASYNPKASSVPFVAEEFDVIFLPGDYIDGNGPIWQPQAATDIMIVGIYQGQPINPATWVSFSGKLGRTMTNSYQGATALDGSSLPGPEQAECDDIGSFVNQYPSLVKKYTKGDPPDGLGTRPYVNLSPYMSYCQIYSAANNSYVLANDVDNPLHVVVVQDDASDSNQWWYVDRWSSGFVFWNQATGKVLSPGSLTSPTNVQLILVDQFSRNCIWAFEGDEGTGFFPLTVAGASGDLLVGVRGGNPQGRSAVELEENQSTPAASQLWGLGGDEIYVQITVRTNPAFALSVDPLNTSGGILLDTADATKSEQLWLRSTGTQFTLQNKKSHLYLRANGAGNLVTQVATPDSGCQWNLGNDEGGDYHAVRAATDSSKQNLDVQGGSSAVKNRAPIDTYSWSSNSWQMWQLTPEEIAAAPSSGAGGRGAA
jgi:hypothetical protein